MSGKIYKITIDGNDKIYIGSTFETINKRMRIHFATSDSITSYNRKISIAIREVNTEKVHIELLKEYPDLYDDKLHLRELQKIETEYIIKYDTINNGLNMRLSYVYDPKEAHNIDAKKYKEKNKEKINLKRRIAYKKEMEHFDRSKFIYAQIKSNNNNIDESKTEINTGGTEESKTS